MDDVLHQRAQPKPGHERLFDQCLCAYNTYIGVISDTDTLIQDKLVLYPCCHACRDLSSGLVCLVFTSIPSRGNPLARASCPGAWSGSEDDRSATIHRGRRARTSEVSVIPSSSDI